MRIMMGETLSSLGLSGHRPRLLPYTAVKEAVFPFRRFRGADILLSPEMKSTGEVMGLSGDFGGAFRDAQEASGMSLPGSGTVFVSVSDRDKTAAVQVARSLHEAGFRIVATGGTARALEAAGIPSDRVLKVKEGRPHIVDLIKDGEVHLVINTVSGKQAQKDSLSIRQETLLRNIPYYTTIEGAKALVLALEKRPDSSGPRSLQELHRLLEKGAGA
jgi:carbamoyl-phosphate synthase large subunit